MWPYVRHWRPATTHSRRFSRRATRRGTRSAGCTSTWRRTARTLTHPSHFSPPTPPGCRTTAVPNTCRCRARWKNFPAAAIARACCPCWRRYSARPSRACGSRKWWPRATSTTRYVGPAPTPGDFSPMCRRCRPPASSCACQAPGRADGHRALRSAPPWAARRPRCWVRTPCSISAWN